MNVIFEVAKWLTLFIGISVLTLITLFIVGFTIKRFLVHLKLYGLFFNFMVQQSRNKKEDE